MRRLLAGLLFVTAALWLGWPRALSADDLQARACPKEMVRVNGFCIDRFEVSMVDRATGEALSPYYPPDSRLLKYSFQLWERLRHRVGPPSALSMPLPELSAWQRTHEFEPRAVSKRGVTPQGYVSYFTGQRACRNAGKRLCSAEEWETACRGARQTRYPYGDAFNREACNTHSPVHPADVLHGAAYFGHLDPRLNLLTIAGEQPLLRATGSTRACESSWGEDAVWDMVGNLDEWVEDKHFRGGFYARGATKGCDAAVTVHGPAYLDYSTGVRCCLSP